MRSEEDSQKIAADYLGTSPTFRFDGIDSTVKLVRIARLHGKPDSWRFEYQFQCRHAGHGDRSGQMLAQVITEHRAQIVVEQGEIVQAVIDGKWDELTHKIIG